MHGAPQVFSCSGDLLIGFMVYFFGGFFYGMFITLVRDAHHQPTGDRSSKERCAALEHSQRQLTGGLQ